MALSLLVAPSSSPAGAPHCCVRLRTGLRTCRCSLASSAHEQLLWKELARNPTQSPLSSQTLQIPEKQRKTRASHRQPASAKGALSHIFQRRQHAQNGDPHEVQILSKAAAAASGALAPGDAAKICIKQFTAPTRPGFNGLGRCRPIRSPGRAPPPHLLAKPHHQGSSATSSVNLCWTPRGKGPTLPPSSQTAGIQRSRKPCQRRLA